MCLIAIIDDNHQSCRFLQQMLLRVGHVSVCLHTGTGAAETLRQVRPDLVLLDVKLPDISGIDVLRQLRQEPQLTALPVIMFSGDSELHVQAQAFELGAADFIVKGMEWHIVLERISALLPQPTGESARSSERLS